MKKTVLALFLGLGSSLFAQDSYRVLFIGNSYIGSNNLPQLIKDITESQGDALEYDAHTPGGNTLETHSSNPTVLSKISTGNWDYVVLQEQSQRPAFPPGQVAGQVYPYAEILCDSIRSANACTRPMFFMTWGRKNGDAQNCDFYPVICTYEGMQQRLSESYIEMAENNDYAVVSPVGAAWKNFREEYPDIELYTGDESHPNIHGSYLAACVFYSSIYGKTSVGASHPNAISAEEANRIQTIASNTVLNNLSEWLMPNISTTYNGGSSVDFNFFIDDAADTTLWDFGDGTTSDEQNPTHEYSENGEYTVKLHYSYGECTDGFDLTTTVNLTTVALPENEAWSLIKTIGANQYQISHLKGQSFAIELYNTQGQLVLQQENTNQYSLDVSAFPSGMYQVRIVSGNNEVLHKIVKY